MENTFDHETWTTLSNDIVIHKKFYLTHLPDKLLNTGLPGGVSQSLMEKVHFRRSKALQFRNDPTWPLQILQALSNLCFKEPEGAALKEIRESHLLNPLQDYVKHLHYFLLTASDMHSKGLRMIPLGPNCSRIHDLDKLDPIMLAGYAERFEDGLETELWSACVKNHVTQSPHHPEHQIWQINGKCVETGISTNDCPHCEGLRFLAVREMICDRVSRRAQKEMGEMGPAAWDISPKWFTDLPKKWFDIAISLIEDMKGACYAAESIRIGSDHACPRK